MIWKTRSIGSALFVVAIFATSDAWAQYRNPTRPDVNINRGAVQRPTVSPYLQLLNNNFVDVPQYQTQVRPQIEQQEFNRQQAAALQNVQRQIAAGAAGAAGAISQPAGPSDIRGTGHATRFRELMHVGRDRATGSRERRPIFLDYSRFYVTLANRRAGQ